MRKFFTLVLVAVAATSLLLVGACKAKEEVPEGAPATAAEQPKVVEEKATTATTAAAPAPATTTATTTTTTTATTGTEHPKPKK